MKYGTSGFRDKAEKIIDISNKIGLIICYLSLQNNLNYGIMITASHNEYLDNGVKIVNYKGEMISSDEEEYIENYINGKLIITKLPDILAPKTIFIGNDTRQSCLEIKKKIIEGIKNVTNIIKIIDYNFVSTPQHHYLVNRSSNNKFDYIDKFKILNDLDLPTKNLLIDCANGVGSIVLENFNFKLINTDVNNYKLLNFKSGSDYVISENKLPENFIHNYIGCSLDGDADRYILYFYDDNELKILDGDYIGALYLYSLCKQLEFIDGEYSIGYIHSPYTNSGLLDWIKEINQTVNIVCTATGVKNLHHEALKYDVSVYFESNGHGTMLINNKDLLKNHYFKTFNLINNEIVGDGICGLFCVLYCLVTQNIDCKIWYNFFTKKKSLLYKKKVKDKNLFVTNNIGNRLIEPIELQNKLDYINLKYNCKSFIRPSGTEDLIRIYIEGNNYEAIKNEIDKMI
tara:strand:- start:219 stop:1592 length:1374 start_codon:yes stop_codon:yes gene_type:complete